MSGQLSFLTSELQALSKEAGRRHGDVKEVCQRMDGWMDANGWLADMLSGNGHARRPPTRHSRF